MNEVISQGYGDSYSLFFILTLNYFPAKTYELALLLLRAAGL